MKSSRTAKLVLIAAVGVLAVGSMAGLALARDDGHRSHKRHHGHDRHHGGPAGTISSFDAKTGVLTISLLGDDSVSGLVTDRTKIKCEDEHAPETNQLRHGEEEPGDDRGGHDDNGTGANCAAADLVDGAVVEEAELELEHGVATFEEVELAD